MSGIMRRVIAEPVQAALASDRDLGPGTAYLGLDTVWSTSAPS
jgi:hypothetical protein